MRLLLILSISLICFKAPAQTIEGCENISFNSDSEVNNSEACILQLSTYALTQPMLNCSEEGHYAKKVVFAWIEKTPNYNFSLNNKIMKIFDDDNLLLFTTYTACLANAALTKGEGFEKYALELFVKYIRNPDNEARKSKAITKLIASWDKNDIDKYLE